MISWVGLSCHSSTLISGCCSSSEALGVLICLFTLECLGSSSSSKLLNSGILYSYEHIHMQTHKYRQKGNERDKKQLQNRLCCWGIVLSFTENVHMLAWTPQYALIFTVCVHTDFTGRWVTAYLLNILYVDRRFNKWMQLLKCFPHIQHFTLEATDKIMVTSFLWHFVTLRHTEPIKTRGRSYSASLTRRKSNCSTTAPDIRVWKVDVQKRQIFMICTVIISSL